MSNTKEQDDDSKVAEEKSAMSISSIQLSEIQFSQLLSKMQSATITNKNFTRCGLRFFGERDHNKVEEFVTVVEIYKNIENISDDDALTR